MSKKITRNNRLIDRSPFCDINTSNTFRIMWAYTMMCFCHITIPTQNLKPFGKIIHSQPFIESISTNIFTKNLSSMFISPSINMVNRQKFNMCFSTTITNFTIMVKNIFFKFIKISSLFLSIFFRIVFYPLFTCFTMFFFKFRTSVFQPLRIFISTYFTQFTIRFKKKFTTSWANTFFNSFIINPLLFVIIHLNHYKQYILLCLNTLRLPQFIPPLKGVGFLEAGW